MCDLSRRCRFGMRADLAPTRAALEALGHPERALRIIHVAGTVGKGSTAAFIEAALRASGLRTGLYTSPHLSRFTERIRIAGREIAQDELARWGEVAAKLAPDLTLFEVATVIAFASFREHAVDVAVVETGLGGRLDATNIVTPEVCVLTRIGWDHTAILGSTLGEIAGEKAGILKRGARWFSAPQADDVQAALPWDAIECVSKPWEGAVALAGAHQRENAALAAAVARHFGVRDEMVRQAFCEVQWPGRLERIGNVLLDCAHNLSAAQALVDALCEPRTILFGCLRDKDARGMIEALSPRATSWIFVRPRSDRARDPRELLRHVPRARVCDSIRDALALAGGPVLVTGSTYVVGEAREVLLGELGDPIPIGDVVATGPAV